MSVEIVEFEAERAPIAGLAVATAKQVTDRRGTVREMFRRSAFEEVGVELARFDQVNVTESHRGVIRGMHAESMTKLVTVAAGEAFGAYVDLRAGTAGFGRVHTVWLRPGTTVVVPPGVANGFQATSEVCQYLYCFDAEWQPGMAGTACTPLDPDLGIDWPIDVGDDVDLVSVKDRASPTIAELVGAPGGER